MVEGSNAKSEWIRVRRIPKRGAYDRRTIDAIIDATVLCHVGYAVDGRPVVTPTLHWRDGDRIYWHGSSASRALRASTGADVCLTITHLDGLVLARSAFHHSANYRSVMLFGVAEVVSDRTAKASALRKFVDGLFPGRWDTLRPVTDKELTATTVMTMAIDEASAKVRTGPPVDDDPDYELPIWAGLLPLSTELGDPIADPRNLPNVELPDGELEAIRRKIHA